MMYYNGAVIWRHIIDFITQMDADKAEIPVRANLRKQHTQA